MAALDKGIRLSWVTSAEDVVFIFKVHQQLRPLAPAEGVIPITDKLCTRTV